MAVQSDHFILQALGLASQALFTSSPNPRVGCVLVNPAGEVIGEGFTQTAGGAHAEVVALQQASLRSKSVVGATAYVTLEPCSHFGRTGPCCDALIASGIAKVVASIADPNPLLSGKGFDRLRAAGIEVVVGIEAERARELNLGFFSRMIRGKPWVRLKIAASLDGTTALENGSSKWITGTAARADGHEWRARACAVLSGIGTILEDDPSLDVREISTTRQPSLVIVDSRLQLPANARVLRANRSRYIYTAAQEETKKHALDDSGVTVIRCSGPANRVDLPAMLRDLAQRGVNELHVEAGARLNGSFLREGLADEILLYMAPRFLGNGKRMADFGPLEQLADGLALDIRELTSVGSDIRVLARVSGRDRF